MKSRRETKPKSPPTIYESSRKIAEAYGIPHLFDGPEKEAERKSNEMTIKLCKFIIEKNSNPNTRSVDAEERRLATFWLWKKAAKKGQSNRVFYPSDQKIAEEHGLPDLFEIEDPEKRHNLMTKACAEWIKANGKFPKTTASCPTEKRLAVWIANQKRRG